MIRTSFITILYLIIPISLIAQNPGVNEYIDINNLQLPIDNKGVLADVQYDPFGPTMKLNETSVLFSGGFMLSGYADEELFANGVISASLIEDYKAGKVGSNPEDSLNIIYKVTAESEPFGNEWRNWKDAVNQGAYYYDGDNNGIYDPVDINGNGTWDPNEDKPDLLYDATYFCVYNDAVPSELRRWNKVEPLGIEIRQTLFVSKNDPLRNTIFVRYSILNTGQVADTLKQMIFTCFADPDIGDHVDDLVGCDTTMQSGFGYNAGEDSDIDGAPPALFLTLLQGPRKHTNDSTAYAVNKLGTLLGEQRFSGYENLGISSHTFYARASFDHGDPDHRQHARFYALGLNKEGAQVDPCSFEFGNVFGMECSYVNPFYHFSGDPVSGSGWLDTSATDVRIMVNSGEFELVKNEPVDIIVAYTAAQGENELHSITETKKLVESAIKAYENNFDNIVGVTDEQDEMVNEYKLLQNYPNPFNPATTIKFTIPANTSPLTKGGTQGGFTKLVVYDILGREVATLVNKQMHPGSYEVDFNASHLASGVYFYRLKSGSFVQTKKMLLIK